MGPKWAQTGPKGPRAQWARGPIGPRAKWAHLGPHGLAWALAIAPLDPEAARRQPTFWFSGGSGGAGVPQPRVMGQLWPRDAPGPKGPMLSVKWGPRGSPRGPSCARWGAHGTPMGSHGAPGERAGFRWKARTSAVFIFVRFLGQKGKTGKNEKESKGKGKKGKLSQTSMKILVFQRFWRTCVGRHFKARGWPLF